jgi:hypothetical protein
MADTDEKPVADGSTKSRYNQLATSNRSSSCSGRASARDHDPHAGAPRRREPVHQVSNPLPVSRRSRRKQPRGQAAPHNPPAQRSVLPLLHLRDSLEKIAGQEGMRAEIEEAFDRMERAVMGEIETGNTRTVHLRGAQAAPRRGQRARVPHAAGRCENVQARPLRREA